MIPYNIWLGLMVFFAATGIFWFIIMNVAAITYSIKNNDNNLKVMGNNFRLSAYNLACAIGVMFIVLLEVLR